MLSKQFGSLIRPLYKNLTGGESISDLSITLTKLKTKNLEGIVDYAKEYTKGSTRQIIEEYYKVSTVDNYQYIAIKPSSFEFDYGKIDNLVDFLIKNNKKVLVDAENIEYYEKINKITDDLIHKYNKKDINIYKTYQMYIEHNYNLLNRDIDLFNNLGIKLVRGAYHNQDKKSGKLLMNKCDTDKSYTEGLELILEKTRMNYSLHSFVCTHNKENINQLINWVKLNKDKKDYLAHASLFGFINNETNEIKKHIKTYKYVPYGPVEDTVPYLIRRIYENPKVLFYYFS